MLWLLGFQAQENRIAPADRDKMIGAEIGPSLSLPP
jgi:hypothetical protein